MTPAIRLDHATIHLVGSHDILLTYTMPGHAPLTLAPPRWSLDGREAPGAVAGWQAGARRGLPNGCCEETWSGDLVQAPGHRLELTLRWAADDPVLRFRFSLHGPGQLTKPEGRDRLCFLACDLNEATDIGLVELSAFNELIHGYLPVERELQPGVREMGPIVVARRGGQSLLLAYEQGSQANDVFLAYVRDGTQLSLDAVQGTYCRGDVLPLVAFGG